MADGGRDLLNGGVTADLKPRHSMMLWKFHGTAMRTCDRAEGRQAFPERSFWKKIATPPSVDALENG